MGARALAGGTILLLLNSSHYGGGRRSLLNFFPRHDSDCYRIGFKLMSQV